MFQKSLTWFVDTLYSSNKQLILVGEKGSKIQSICTESRKEIQALLHTAVELVLVPIYNPKKFTKLAYEAAEEEE